MKKNAIIVAAVTAVCSGSFAVASSETWTGLGGDSQWANGGNWTNGTAPGRADGVFTSTDIATFSATSAPTDPIANINVTVDANRNVGGIVFDNVDSTNFTLGGEALHITGGGSIVGGANVVNSAPVNSNFVINSPIVVHGDSLTFTANQPVGRQGGILPRGPISFVTPANATLIFDGTNTDNQNVQQSTNQLQIGLSDPSGGSLSVVKNGSGTWEFYPQETSAEPFFTYSGDTIVNQGIIRLRGQGSVGSLTASGASPNSRYVSNGGIIRFGFDGLIAKSVQLNDPTVHQALRVSNTQGVKVRLAADTGPALQMNFNSSTPAGVLPTNNHIIFLGTNDYEGGIELNNNGNPIGPVTIGQTQVAYDFGDKIRPIDVDLGDTSLGSYDLRIVAQINGSAGLVKLGAGRLRLDSVANEISGVVEVREGTLLLNNANSFTNRPALQVTGGTFHVAGDQQQTFSSATVSAGAITASNSGSRLAAESFTMNPGAGVDVNVEVILEDAGVTAPLTKAGEGRAILTGSNSYTGLTTVQAGTLRLNGNSNDVIVGGANVSDPGGADIQGGKIEFDYSSSGSSPRNDIVQALTAGRSTNFADFIPGQTKIKGTTSNANRGLGWIDDAGSQVFTLASTLYGDSDLNFAVDFTDLLTLARNFGGSGLVWADGDSNYDGNVDFTDLLALAKNFNASLAVAGDTLQSAGVSSAFADAWTTALSVVPEPATLATIGGVACLLLRRRRVN